MRVEIDWETVRSVGLGVLLSIGVIVMAWRAYEDDMLIHQVVSYLNQQQVTKPAAAPPANTQSNPPEVKR